MAVCVVKYHHMCETCRGVCHSLPESNPEHSAVELNDLCSPCLRGLKSSFVEAINYSRNRELVKKVQDESPWLKEQAKARAIEFS